MICYRRSGRGFVAFRYRTLFVGLSVVAVLASMHFAYTANLRLRLDDAREQIETLETQLRISEQIIQPPRQSRCSPDHSPNRGC